MKVLFSVFIFLFLFSCSSEKESPLENENKVSVDSATSNPFPEQKITRGSDETNGLRMIAEIRGDSVIFVYTNTSPNKFCLWTETKGYSLTWNYVRLNINETRSIVIEFDLMERERQGLPVSVWLGPGEDHIVKENLQRVIQTALKRKQIGVEPGEYTVEMYYDSGKGPLDRVSEADLKTEHWKGKLKVTGLNFELKAAALK